MRYMLVNTSRGNLQVDLFNPEHSYKSRNLHRMAPVVSLNLGKGKSVDLLPYFDGSLEKAHDCVKHSRDVLRMLRPDRLHIYVCDDAGERVDVEALLGNAPKVKEKAPESVVVEKGRVEDDTPKTTMTPEEAEKASKREDETKPDMELSATSWSRNHSRC